jgi:DNA-binding response OmpR family regulator
VGGSRIVTVVHPDSETRRFLQSALQAQGRTVVTNPTWSALLSDRSAVDPGVILLDRALSGPDGIEVLSLINQKWVESVIVFLPEGLEDPGTRLSSVRALIRNVERLLGMQSTRDLLAV